MISSDFILILDFKEMLRFVYYITQDIPDYDYVTLL